jgi:hypothetical protein
LTRGVDAVRSLANRRGGRWLLAFVISLIWLIVKEITDDEGWASGTGAREKAAGYAVIVLFDTLLIRFLVGLLVLGPLKKPEARERPAPSESSGSA